MKTPEQIGADLAEKIQGDVHIDIFNRVAFSTDASIYQILPQCVAAPRSEQDVLKIVSYARENKLPLAPRGAGSGVAGESLTCGIVLDIRRYLDKILEIAPDGSWVIVQPGVVLDTLNEALRPYGRMIGPDPSSSNRAVIGGCLANNATGAHSLKYGYFAEHVDRVRAILADGTVVNFINGVRPMETDTRLETELARRCLNLLDANSDLIARSQPGTKRNRSGYNIAHIAASGRIDMARLMAGSEGTLAVFTEIALRTVEIPACKALVQFEFDSFVNMARAVTRITACGAAACELMDQTLMTMARRAYPDYADLLPADCQATLLAEFTGSGPDEARRQTEAACKAAGDLAVRFTEVTDPQLQQRLWKSRKDAVPLLNRDKGAAHPIPFIEDVAVEPSHLAAYIEGLERIGARHHITMAYYGHAGDGELHIRPYIDLSQPEGIAQMKAVAEDVFRLAWSLGGSISGEHADGLVRAAFIQKQYGKEYYEILKEIKRIFDPEGILNPGKILNDDPRIMEKNLRSPAGGPTGQSTLLLGPQEFRFEAEQCSGCGVCLSRSPGARMCPVFRGMNEELFTTRAKANLLRAWSNPPKDIEPFEKQALRRVLSLCVNCKMCSVQCPAGVDISKLIIETRAQLARETGFSVTELALSHNRRLSAAAAFTAPLSNWILDLPLTRLLMEKTMGLDRTRRFPHFQRGSLIARGRRFLKQQPPIREPADRVVYFVDSYANWNDHELGMAVIQLLRTLDIEVVIPPQRPAPLPAYVYGNLKTARKDLEYNCGQLAPYVRDGYKIVCSEPSAALCLREEMKFLIDSEAARSVAHHTLELMDYLNRLEKQGRLDPWKRPAFHSVGKLAYHSPCHLQVMEPARTTIRLLAAFGITAVDLNGGCCGLAGTAGLQRKNCEVSRAIGNLLARRISQVNPALILTECAACAMQIEHLTGTPVMHPVKILWNHYFRRDERRK